jgi:hypothetical protein
MGKQVHYVISTKPAIEQAVGIASECGIEVAAYAGGSWYTPAISENGRIRVYFTTAGGNVVADRTHWQTWDLLHPLVGRPASSLPRGRSAGGERSAPLRPLFDLMTIAGADPRSSAHIGGQRASRRRRRDAALPRRRTVVFEQLEPRCVLSAQTSALMHPTFILHRSGNGSTPFAASSPTGLTPAQIRHAYGFDQITFGGVQGDGTGQTVAIIDAYDSPTILSDLQAFDANFGIPNPPSFTRVAQNGTTNYPGTDPAGAGNANGTWEMETALDVEWAHALAPKANILLIEANSPSNSDLMTAAVGYARSLPGISVITMSFGQNEFSGESSFDSLFTTPSGHSGITFLAATGDNGQPSGYPAYSPNVVAVGGTTLNVD